MFLSFSLRFARYWQRTATFILVFFACFSGCRTNVLSFISQKSSLSYAKHSHDSLSFCHQSGLLNFFYQNHPLSSDYAFSNPQMQKYLRFILNKNSRDLHIICLRKKNQNNGSHQIPFFNIDDCIYHHKRHNLNEEVFFHLSRQKIIVHCGRNITEGIFGP